VNGGEVKVHIKDNGPAFEITPAPPKLKAKPKKKTARKKAGGEAPAAE
jgi:ATP-dependent Clp protease ATP-binding subunit ClpA